MKERTPSFRCSADTITEQVGDMKVLGAVRQIAQRAFEEGVHADMDSNRGEGASTLAATTAPAEDALLVSICNLSMIGRAYGECFRQDVVRSAFRRLSGLGLRSVSVVAFGDSIVLYLRASGARRVLIERCRQAVCAAPVMHGTDAVYLNIAVREIDWRRCGAQRADTGDGIGEDPNKHPGKDWARGYRADMRLAHALFEDMRGKRLLFAFQPVYCTDEQAQPPVLYHEALLRRIDVRGGEPLSCAATIRALERLQLMWRLDQSVLWCAIELLAAHPHLRLGCNLSVRSLQPWSWWEPIFERLRDDDALATRLTVEIAETAILEHAGDALALVAALKLLGCRVAIDNFGSGHSTMDFMVQCRPDVIKIDRSLVTQDPTQKRTPYLMLRDLGRLCAHVTRCVVAEGVENDDELYAAVSVGLRGVQGYHLKRPDVAPEWLQSPAWVSDALGARRPRRQVAP
ncbi:EAL domain-containing protein [Xanthomonas sacchari]|nr:EAL domain-containing protein [Xanthomonas sacchari]